MAGEGGAVGPTKPFRWQTAFVKRVLHLDEQLALVTKRLHRITVAVAPKLVAPPWMISTATLTEATVSMVGHADARCRSHDS